MNKLLKSLSLLIDLEELFVPVSVVKYCKGTTEIFRLYIFGICIAKWVK